MKKTLLSAIAMIITLGVLAQNNRQIVQSRLSTQIKNQKSVLERPSDIAIVPNRTVNPTVSSNRASMLETVIGQTTYSLQTNYGTVGNRVHRDIDGTISVVWTKGDQPTTFPDRGTGYNFWNGLNWATIPSSRIETIRTGWPNIGLTSTGREVIVNMGTNPTNLISRPTKGSGSWSSIAIDTTKITWPRMAVGGANGNTIHVFGQPNIAPFKNFYSRSTDGGITWIDQNMVLPNFNNYFFEGSNDAYDIVSRGNMVAIVLGGFNESLVLYKSLDNGATWTTTVINEFPLAPWDYNNSISDVNGDGIADTIPTTDSGISCIIDNNGIVHVAVGSTRIWSSTTPNVSYYPGTDGLLYWNETMPAGDITNNIIASSEDIDGSGFIELAPNVAVYPCGLTSMPALGVDASNNIHLVYSSVIENTTNGNPDPAWEESYRNTYYMYSSNNGATWSTPSRLNPSNFDEMVWPMLPKNIGGIVDVFYHKDGEPGNNFQPVGNPDPITPIDIIYAPQPNSLLNGVIGRIWRDFNNNCNIDTLEDGPLTGIRLVIQPGNYIAQSIGNLWRIDSLPPGTYTVTMDTTNNNWSSTCPITQSFSVLNSSGITYGPDFGLVSNNPCSDPVVSIFSPFIRRCFTNQLIYVSACNSPTGSSMISSSYLDVQLDSLIILNNATISYSILGNNTYRFNLGDILPNQCIDFQLNTTISCNAQMNQTLCMAATLFPVDSCAFDTTSGGGGIACNLPWDQSSLSVDGYCQNDSACFVIRNSGDPVDGDMECYSQIRIFVDGVLTVIDSLQLAGGDSLIYCYYANGQTIRLEVDQHPLHPGNSHPNDVVELCGNPNNWTPGLVTSQPQDDADPVVDIYCGVVTGSYDPNDKMGLPTGLTSQHFIQPNQQLQYMIRFQNTGNDTAFTVVIRDTLDPNLNIFTVTPGVASHPYQFRMYGPRVLEWRFENIMLPDSNVNEPASNGFATFHVEQNPNLAQGTIIRNDADIYFDFNAPVITNETEHKINYGSPLGIEPISQSVPQGAFELYPNPTTGAIKISTDLFRNENYQITDLQGRVLMSGELNGEETTLIVDYLSQGVYVLKLLNTPHSIIFVKQ